MNQKATFFHLLFIVLVGIAAIVPGLACYAAGNIRLPTGAAQLADKPFIVGHRGAAGLAPENTLAALLDESHQLGLKVYVWTVDSRNDMVRLIEMGVDGIITNRPDILIEVVGLQ